MKDARVKKNFHKVSFTTEIARYKALVPFGRIMCPIVHDSDKYSNREQPETNRNDENAMCDYLSEYLRMCFRLYEYFLRLFLDILRTFCERSKIAED